MKTTETQASCVLDVLDVLLSCSKQKSDSFCNIVSKWWRKPVIVEKFYLKMPLNAAKQSVVAQFV